MSEMALQLIAAVKKGRKKKLVLSNLILTKQVLTELSDMPWLENLSLKMAKLVSDRNDVDLSDAESSVPGSIRYLLYSTIANFVSLRELNLEGLGLTDNEFIKYLPDLEVLDISRNRMKDISIIASCKKLRSLDISRNPLSNLPTLAHPSELRTLVAHNTSIRDIEPIGQLTHLQKLHLSDTLCTDLSPLGKLLNLRVLFLSGSAADNLDPISGLIELEELYFSGTKVASIDALANMTKLRSLAFSRTNVSDISPLKEIIDLENLHLSRTRVESISALINHQSLKELHFSHSKVTDLAPIRYLLNNGIPINRNNSTKSVGVYLDGCPLINPPYEVAEKGSEAILAYWREQDRVGTLPATEIKLFLLGNTTAGKTTLRHALIHQAYDDNIRSTFGADLRAGWDSGDHTIHVWDFGGQEYFHATHRLFMGANSLYGVVADPTFDQAGSYPTPIWHFGDAEPCMEDLEHFQHGYWLDMVRQAAPNGRAWMVWNKLDQANVPPHGLSDGEKQRFVAAGSRIMEFDSSLLAGLQAGVPKWKRHFEGLREDILEAAAEALKGQKVIRYWPKIRDALQVWSAVELAISKVRFDSFCSWMAQGEDFEDFDAEKLDFGQLDPFVLGNIITYLRDMCGAILYWDVDGLRDQLFINPNQINQLIYAVLDRSVKDQEGRFDRAHARGQVGKAMAALQGIGFGDVELDTLTDTLLRVMRQFEIVFEVAAGSGEFVAPQYLSRNEPDSLPDLKRFAQVLPAFGIRFKSYIPRHIVPRFIVRRGLDVIERNFWKLGILYQEEKVNVLLQVDYEQNTIFIAVQDPLAHRSTQFAILSMIRELCAMDEALEVAPMGKPWVDLQSLEEATSMQNDRFHSIDRQVVETSDYSFLIHSEKQQKSMKRAYIAYARHDGKHLQALETALNIYKQNQQLSTWSRAKLGAGDVITAVVAAERMACDVAVVLLSASSFDTTNEKDCVKDCETLLQRFDNGEIRLLPVIVEPFNGYEISAFGQRDLQPIRLEGDHGWMDVVKTLMELKHEALKADIGPNVASTKPLPKIGILTALPHEYAAVKSIMTEVDSVKLQHGGGSFGAMEVGLVPGLDGNHAVVLAMLPDMGNNLAAAVSGQLMTEFPSVEVLWMVGIAGGVPNPGKAEDHVRLGDIVVSGRNGVVQYDMGKDEDGKFTIRNAPRPPAPSLLTAIQKLSGDLYLGVNPLRDQIAQVITAIPLAQRPEAKMDVLHDTTNSKKAVRHPKDNRREENLPRVFQGTIASSNTLLKNAIRRDALRDQFSVKAVEMEGSGVADAAWLNGREYLVIRGICDYCDGAKKDAWQLYAAAVAAAYAKMLLGRLHV